MDGETEQLLEQLTSKLHTEQLLNSKMKKKLEKQHK